MVMLSGTMEKRKRWPQAPPCAMRARWWTYPESLCGYSLIKEDVQVWKAGRLWKGNCNMVQEIIITWTAVDMREMNELKWIRRTSCWIGPLGRRWFQFTEAGRSRQSSGEEAALARSEAREIALWGKDVTDNMIQNFFLSYTRPWRSRTPTCTLGR